MCVWVGMCACACARERERESGRDRHKHKQTDRLMKKIMRSYLKTKDHMQAGGRRLHSFPSHGSWSRGVGRCGGVRLSVRTPCRD